MRRAQSNPIGQYSACVERRTTAPLLSEKTRSAIRKPLPFPDGSASVIYASHVLEHLYFEEGKRLIREAFRVLDAGGILRVVVPDLNTIVQEYLGERPFGQLSGEFGSLRPADLVNHRLLMYWPTAPTGNLLYRNLQCVAGFSFP
jgi:SAM-dependent methyltransferase